MNDIYPDLVHIRSHDELRLYELIPTVVWIFDLDRHGWWWGNRAALDFWGLETLDELVNKDLSGDTQGARDRTRQTFDLAARDGLTIDPWTTYPNGKPKTLHMMHRAVLVGPDKHRAIIAYINEEVNLGETPENLLLVEAMRYTQVLVTSFTMAGDPVVENPAATEAYRHIDPGALAPDVSFFVARFEDPLVGERCLAQARADKGGRWTHSMRTTAGVREHTLDIRMTRHPLSGDFLLLVSEYDVTPLHTALKEAREAQEKLRQMAYYDALTGLPGIRLFKEMSDSLLKHAHRDGLDLAVMFIDLDGFKGVNDNYGHDMGDALLKEVAVRLKDCLRESDLVARIGGDEFVVLQWDVSSENDIARVARKLIDSLVAPFKTEEAELSVGASIGISLYPRHGEDVETLLKVADEAMYRVKDAGKNDFHIAG